MKINAEQKCSILGAKSAEEVLKILKAGSEDAAMEDAEKIFKEISAASDAQVLDEEILEQVSGGSHMTNGRTYSDEGHMDPNGQIVHRLIVTKLNSCQYWSTIDKSAWFDCCYCCVHHDSDGFVYYCMYRTEENGL